MVDVTDLNPDFYGNLQRFMAAAPSPLSIVSGYRSPEHQAQLWQAALDKYGSPEAARKWVAPPGHSMHNQGMAVDLGYGGVGGTGLGGGSQSLINWAHQHAADYGLTFPLANENWHIEPIGARSSNATTQPTPQPETASATSPSSLMSPLANVQSGDAFSPAQMMAQQFPPMLDAMRSFQQGYSSDKFMSDMFAGQNPMRHMVYGALGSLFRGLFV